MSALEDGTASRAAGRPGYDEAQGSDGAPRACYREVLDALGAMDLDQLQTDVARRLAVRQVTFGRGRPFVVDPVPRVIDAREWGELEAGLRQRVRALNAFLRDVYGERRIVEAGVVPAAAVDGAAFHEPVVTRLPLPAAPATVAGLDVVRGAGGEWLVLEDNLRTPSGLAYALAAREALDDLLPVPAGRREIGGAITALRAALAAAAPDPSGGEPFMIVLNDGARNSAAFEHRRLARRLGLPLVRVDQLRLRPDGVYAPGPEGVRKVDVIYRRTDEDRLADRRGRGTPLGELLFEPLAEGQLAVANAFGTGVADDKLLHGSVEAMIRFYLEEEPRLKSVPTYDLSDADRRDDVLSRLDELVVKPRDGAGGTGVLVGPVAAREDLERRRREVEEEPDAWVAQETVWLSEHPTVVDGALEPRRVDLRAFAVSVGDEVRVVPGGLTRVALEAGSLVVNSSQNGGGKDTWVLG